MKLSEPEPEHRLPPALVSAELSPEAEPLSSTLPALTGERRAWEQMFRALRHRNFRLFVAGQVVSLIGTFMQTVAQSWLVYRLTHSEWLLGATWFCTQIPVFVLGPLGGLAADRHSRHRIVVTNRKALQQKGGVA